MRAVPAIPLTPARAPAISCEDTAYMVAASSPLTAAALSATTSRNICGVFSLANIDINYSTMVVFQYS